MCIIGAGTYSRGSTDVSESIGQFPLFSEKLGVFEEVSYNPLPLQGSVSAVSALETHHFLYQLLACVV